MVAEQYPWPAGDGYRQRLHHLISGLAQAGEVDVVALHREGTAAPVEPPLPGVRVPEVFSVGGDAGIRSWIGQWVRGDMPRRMLGPDWSPVRAALDDGRFRGGERYDLVWYSHVDSWWALHDRLEGVPSIVDFDNLEHLALALRRRIPPRFVPGSGVADRLRVIARWAASRAFDLVDQRRWNRIQRRCAASVAHVAVCSELDVQRSGCPNAVVVPNGSDAPPEPVTERRDLREEHPTFLFVGALDYEPNTEAVGWLAREIAPALRRRVPDARIRVVGRGRHAVAWASEVDGVDLVGPVDDIRAELRRADVSVVPIRVGAGTRLKVVEALAHRLPLVTTTVGCEGIDVTDGVDALIVDDAEGFADECARLARDGALRQRLADAGAALFAARYDWARIERGVAELARQVVSPGGRG